MQRPDPYTAISIPVMLLVLAIASMMILVHCVVTITAIVLWPIVKLRQLFSKDTSNTHEDVIDI